MKLKATIILPVLMMTVSSCQFINDLIYPNLKGVFETFEVEGASKVVINNLDQTIDITMEETADLSSVRVVSYTLGEKGKINPSVPEVLDLTQEHTFVITTYPKQHYTWTIRGSRPIDRHVIVENQVGEVELNLDERSAIVYVMESQDLSSVTFLDMKLEPGENELISSTGWTLGGDGETPVVDVQDCVLPKTYDCVLARTFKMNTYRGEVSWLVKVLNKEVEMQVDNVNAFCYHAVVQGSFSGQGSPSIEYRKASGQEWIDAGHVTVAGVGVSVDITALDPDTEYVARILNGEEKSPEYKFRTEAEAQLSNMNFDTWHLDGKVWYPYAQGESAPVWDSANKATSQFIGSSTTPEETLIVKGKAARMESKYAMIAFAAGNLYTGRFCNIAGMGAELDWGVPFTSRPAVLKGYFSYQPKPIDRTDNTHKHLVGTMDKCQIQVFLTDWDEPFHINTSKGIFVDFENDKHIIAHAMMESDKTTDGFEPFELKLQYRDVNRKPRYCVISCAASYMGDYFSGGVGSLLYVDEFEFVYE